jgi:zinc transport system ATP-binding protein
MPKRVVAKSIVSIDHVSFGYVGGANVLEDVSLSVAQGEYLGLIGPNGGGKSTLAKIMLGLLTPSSGSVSLFGHSLDEFRDWHRIGYVPQKPSDSLNAFPATVLEVVLMGRIATRGLFRRFTAEDYEHATGALKTVGITDLAQRQIGELSGGQQQRVFIARALVGHPDLIVLDEPTVGVESKIRDDFYKLLRALHQDHHHTLILISHDLGCVEREVSRMVEVNQTLGVHRHG